MLLGNVLFSKFNFLYPPYSSLTEYEYVARKTKTFYATNSICLHSDNYKLRLQIENNMRTEYCLLS